MKSDIKLEFKILKTLCNGSEEIVGQLFPSLRAEHFSSSITQGLFRRIFKLHTQGGEIPFWRDLSLDPGVRPDTRKAMREVKVRPFETRQELNSSLGTLDRLRQVRLLFELGANLEKQLDEDEIDPEEVARAVQSELGKISKFGSETKVTRIGEKGNSIKLAKRILYAEASNFISTGFKAFDDKNVGFPSSGVILLAANTSGFKSGMLDNILENMAMKGARVAKYPLEMSSEEVHTRDMARVSMESMTNLIDPAKRITSARKEEILQKVREYNKKLAKRGGCIDIIEPGFDPSLEAMLSYVDPFDYDVVAVDYVGLMAGMTGDDQWRVMSNALAYAKRWSGRPHKKTMLIFAAQLAADDTLRQSKAMPDHVTNFWYWRLGKEERDSGIALVKQGKCRFGELYDFPVKFDLEHMSARDLTQKEYSDWIEAQKAQEKGMQGKGDSWKSGSKKKKVELPEDDDDDYEGEQVQERPKMRKRKRTSEY